MGKTYIHYGNDHFDMKIFENDAAHPGDNSWKNKPPFGFWGSPVGEEYYTWKQQCVAEDFRTECLNESFEFVLKDTAKILTVNSISDCEDYIARINDFGRPILDFNKIMAKYDGMELIHEGHWGELDHPLHGIFNSWDVDSIVIWNPNIIIETSNISSHDNVNNVNDVSTEEIVGNVCETVNDEEIKEETTMDNTTNKVTEKVKGFWNKNKGKIIFGAKCLAVGFGIGFVKGGVDMLAATNHREKVNFYYKIGAMFNTIDAKMDDLSSKLPECDPAAFLKTIKNDDYILNELRNRTYDRIHIDETDIGKDVVEIMKDVLDNHWRADGYEC